MAGAWVKENGVQSQVYLVEVFVDGARVDHTFKDEWCKACNIGVEVTRKFHQKWAYSGAKGWHSTQYQLKSETVARKPYGMEKLAGNPNR